MTRRHQIELVRLFQPTKSILLFALLLSFLSACQTGPTKPASGSAEIPLLVRERTLDQFREQSKPGENFPAVLSRLLKEAVSFPPESLIDEYEQGPIERDPAPRQITIRPELLQRLSQLAGEGIGRTSSGIDFALQRLIQQIQRQREASRRPAN